MSPLQNPPPGYHTVTPSLVVRDANAAIAFYKQAFNAHEIFRLPAADGKVAHAEIKIGDSILMLSDEFPEWDAVAPAVGAPPPSKLMLYVENCDAIIDQAVKAGGSVVMPAADQFWGDRMGVIADPFGHRWTIATHVEEVPPEEMEKRMAAFSASSTP